MRYAEFNPSPQLAAHVRRIWVFESAALRDPANVERIVPDGCPELVVHYGAPFSECTGEPARIQPRALFAGQLSRPLGLRAMGEAGETAAIVTPAFVASRTAFHFRSRAPPVSPA